MMSFSSFEPGFRSKRRIKNNGQSQYSTAEHQHRWTEEVDSHPGETTARIKRKIHDVIRMCEEDQKPGSNELKDIIDA